MTIRLADLSVRTTSPRGSKMIENSLLCLYFLRFMSSRRIQKEQNKNIRSLFLTTCEKQGFFSFLLFIDPVFLPDCHHACARLYKNYINRVIFILSSFVSTHLIITARRITFDTRPAANHLYDDRLETYTVDSKRFAYAGIIRTSKLLELFMFELNNPASGAFRSSRNPAIVIEK